MDSEIQVARQPLGELLIEKGLLTHEHLELALGEHRRTGRRLGEVLVGLGLISGPDLELALEMQRGAELMQQHGFGTGLLSALKGRRTRPREDEVSTRPDESHLLFVPDHSGYGLVEHEGPAPATGARLEVGDTAYVVTKLGRSPLPRDGRSCAYLQALA